MSPLGLEHESDFAKCHHCHITSPIPFDELIKTHPLRSSPVQESNRREKNEAQGSTSKSKTKSTKGKQKREFDIESVLNEVTSNEYRLRKFRNSSSTSEHSSPPKTLNRNNTNNRKYVKPVHSFLLHESSSSPYKISEKTSLPQHTCTLHSRKSHRSETQNSISNGVILDPGNIEATYSYSPSLSKQYASIRKDTKTLRKEPKLKDTQTQTSEQSSVTKANGVLFHGRPSEGEVSVFNIIDREKFAKRKTFDKFICSLPSGLLFAGYGLLIVIAIVVAVALSQRERRISLKSSTFPNRPPLNFAGASLSSPIDSRPSIRSPPTRVRPNIGARKRIQAIQRVSPDAHIISAANVIQAPTQRPLPVPQPEASLNQFREDDLDYFETIGINDQDFQLSSPNAVHQPQALPQPPRHQIPQQSFHQEAFKPVEVQPQFRPQARAPAQEVLTVSRSNQRQQQQASAPRRPVASDEPAPRGQREPEVKIIKSWSNRNADGTFSWGYLNTDGSFKNETKGIDCVVRGIYGYIDKATGDTLTFPYESGNPCDPNAPDYYDYDEGNVNAGGQFANQPKKVNVAARRRP